MTPTYFVGHIRAILPHRFIAAPRNSSGMIEATSGGTLTALDLDIPIEVSPYHIITRRDRRLSPAASRFYALVLEEMARLRE